MSGPVIMPFDLSGDACSAFWDGFHGAPKDYSPNAAVRAGYRALYAHLTAPKTKEVEVWHVEYANNHDCAHVSVRSSRELADNLAALYRQHGHTCIRVTGPHEQTVPA